jgi:membrane associated rhomboid family serine protease
LRTPAVKWLIAANCAAFAVQHLAAVRIEIWFALWPLQAVEGEHLFRVWQILSYSFLHSIDDPLHIVFNLYGLWLFGGAVEGRVGPWRFLGCYFASVATAALGQLFVPALLGASPEPTIGASGGVFGLLLAYAYLCPHERLQLLFPPIAMPAWLFATAYAGVELVLGVTGTLAGVAHFAHLGGMVGSALVITGWRKWRA